MKDIVAELRSSFYANDKSYNWYLIGIIKFTDGEYSCEPTEDDDAYTADKKLEILNGVLDSSLMVQDKGRVKRVTRDDPLFLKYHAHFRTNMYGGLVIIEDKEEGPGKDNAGE